MSNTKYKLSNRALAEKWCTTATTIRRYAKKGCNWDASDYEVAVWLITKCTIKKSSAMREAVYAVPGIRDGDKPEPASEPLNTQAFGAAYEWQERLMAKVAQLREGDTEQAQLLTKELDALDAEFARLDAMISSS
jgi:hypothetical protein